MSMEVTTRNLSARATRARLMNPPGGMNSTDLEVVSAAQLKRMERESALLRMEAEERKAHKARVAALIEQIKQRKEEWRQAEFAWSQLLINRGLTATRITDVCCEYFKVSALDILAQRRQVDICYARHVITYLCCTETKKSLPEIGQFLAGRDHTTCLHSRDKIKRLLAEGDERVVNDIAALRAMLGVE